MRGGKLPALRCLLANETNDFNVPVNLLCDCAATNSYAIDRCAHRAHLNLDNNLSFKEPISGFGGISDCEGYLTNAFLKPIKYSPLSSNYNVSIPVKLRVTSSLEIILPPLSVKWSQLPDTDYSERTEDLPKGPTRIDILLGADMLPKILISIHPDPANSIVLWRTRLGVAVSGMVENLSNLNPSPFPSRAELILVQSQLYNALNLSNDELYDELRKFWSVDDMEQNSSHATQRALSPSERFVTQHFKETTRFENGHYTVSLPFDPDKGKPHNNYSVAVKQFYSVERGLLRDPHKFEQFSEYIESYIENGHARLVETDSPAEDEAYYLPYHGVYKEHHESTKCRVVFNGSSPDDTGWSLNDSLLPGPPLQPELTEVLLRFRRHPVALMGDVHRMFLMIEIEDSQRRWLRFVYRPFGSNIPLKVYEKNVVPFGLKCSPFLAIATMMLHLDTYSKTYPEASALVKSEIYVDDILLSCADSQLAVKLRNDIQEMLGIGKFQVKKWLSNDPEVVESIPEELRAKAGCLLLERKDLAVSEDPISACLGIAWSPSSDMFLFSDVSKLATPMTKETMRSLCSRAAKIYDPAGYISPFLLHAKLLMQSCWTMKLGWDDLLPEEILKSWLKWIFEIEYLQHFRLPRLLIPPNTVSTQLHAFSDASEKAYGSVVYIRSEDKLGNVTVRLAMAKTKVAPLKVITIPRLELNAAVLGARLAHRVQENLHADKVILWSDNMSVLAWIQNPPHSYKTFVANRIAQIQELFSPSQFRFCPTFENPADYASRGMLASDLVRNSDWLQGPVFLSEPEEFWPKQASDKDLNLASKDADMEEKPFVPHSFAALAADPPHSSMLEDLFSLKTGNYFSFSLQLRRLAAVYRFIERCRARKRQSPRPPKLALPSKDELAERMADLRYTREEMHYALLSWAWMVQREFMAEEVAQVSSGQLCPRLKKLQPYWDDDYQLIRVGGRLEFSQVLDFEEKHPVVLPTNCPYVERYIRYTHTVYAHSGPECCLAQVRRKFWILQGRRQVKKALRVCKCYRLRAKRYQQLVAPLPEIRTTPCPAWYRIGIDFAGPAHCLSIVETQKPNAKAAEAAAPPPQSPSSNPTPAVPEGKKRGPTKTTHALQKVWVLVITCLTTRACHFEYMLDQTTDHFIWALQRFMSRRGYAGYILSDNAKTFSKSSREIRHLYQSIDWKIVERHFISLPSPIEWHYIPPKWPAAGGIYEAIVGSMKAAIKAVLGQRTVGLEEFRTALAAAEAICNSRPLSIVSDSVDDNLPLTPAHLVLGRPIEFIPDHLSIDDKSKKGKASATVQWRARQRLSSEFWTRWKREYLAQLQSFSKWLTPEYEPQIDEMVLVVDLDKPRLQWPLARITEINRGRDQRARMCTLKLVRVDPSKVVDPKTLHNPLTKADRKKLKETPTIQTTLRRDIRHLVRLEEPTVKCARDEFFRRSSDRPSSAENNDQRSTSPKVPSSKVAEEIEQEALDEDND